MDGSEIEWALGAGYKEIADFLKVKTNLRVNVIAQPPAIEEKQTQSETER